LRRPSRDSGIPRAAHLWYTGIGMDIKIITDTVSQEELKSMAEGQFVDLVKAVVDIKRRVMAIGGELHADEEAVLLEQGSTQENLWGINLYPGRNDEEFIEFDSMINLRPSQGNRSRGVDDAAIRESIVAVVRDLVR
jgi:hypothetical protein